MTVNINKRVHHHHLIDLDAVSRDAQRSAIRAFRCASRLTRIGAMSRVK